MGGHTPEVERFLLCVCVPVELLLNKIKNLTVERLIKLKGMHVRGREREREMRRQNEGLVTCMELQVPRDHASSFCRDIAIKVAF